MTGKAHSQSVFKEAREKAGLTVEEVAKQINIRKKYIIALEEENYSEIPAKVYIKGYMKMYSEFLGVELPNYEDRQVSYAKTSSSTNIATHIMRWPQLRRPVFAKLLLVSCAVIIIVSYYLYFTFVH